MFCIHKWEITNGEISWKTPVYFGTLSISLFAIFISILAVYPNNPMLIVALLASILFGISTGVSLSMLLFGDTKCDAQAARLFPGAAKDMICLDCGKVYLDATILEEARTARKIQKEKDRAHRSKVANQIIKKCREIRKKELNDD